MKVGFEQVKSWECLYVHRAQHLFLSGYVDDYKMAGKKVNIPKMWERLEQEGIDLEDPVPVHENVYLGCGQKPLQPDLKTIAQKREMFQRICHSSAYGKPDSTAGGDTFREKSVDNVSSSNSNSKKKKRNPTDRKQVLKVH